MSDNQIEPPTTAMQKVVQVHAEYGVPYADTMAAARRDLEAQGCDQVEVGTDQGGHIVLIAHLPVATAQTTPKEA